MQNRNLIASAGLMAVLVVSTATMAAGEPTEQQLKIAEPLLAPWTGPYGGVPPFDKVKVDAFKPALEVGMAATSPKSSASPTNPEAPTFDNTIAALEDRPHARSVPDHLRRLQLDDERRRGPGGRARDGAEARRVPRQDHPERAALRAHRGGLRRAREVGPHARAAAAGLAATTPTSCAPAPSSTRPRRSAWPRSTSELATLFTKFSQNVLADEDNGLVLHRQGGRPRRPAAIRAAPPPQAAAERAARRASGRSRNTRSSMEPFLTYSDPATLREKVWRMFVNRGDNGDAHDNNAIITEILKLRAERAKLLGYPTPRPLAPRELDGEDARARDGADGGGLDSPPSRASTKKSPTCRRSPTRNGARHQDRALGLPLLRREGAQGEVRPRRERGQALPAAREAARRHVLGGGAAVRLSLHAGEPGTVPVYHPDVRVWEVTDDDGRHCRPLVLRSLRARRASTPAPG